MKYRFFIWMILLVLSLGMNAQTQNTNPSPLVRIAHIEIFPEYWEAYLNEAKTISEVSVRDEEGVVCLLPVQLRNQPYTVRVIEVYKDAKAYNHHIQTKHFVQYKTKTQPMVKSLQLIDAEALDTEVLQAIFNKEGQTRQTLPRLITIEEHFTLPSISARVQAWQTQQNGGQPVVNPVQRELMQLVLPTQQDIAEVGERRLQFMDEAGITMQILSYGAGSPQNITDTSVAVELCREANNELARLISKHPDRFAGFASLPVADPEAAADELERCVRELGFKGAMLNGSFNGVLFDAPQFAPIYERAERLGVPLFMHPAVINPKVADYYYKGDAWSAVSGAMFATAGYGWHVDAGITVLRMIMSGLFERYPKLQIISGHWRELVPFYLNRLDDQQSKTLSLPKKISEYYRSNVYITPSGFFSEAQLRYAIEVVGADRILYSGDYPFLIDKETRSFLEGANISNQDKRKIAYLNAEKLFWGKTNPE